eukprot:scaffold1294_cov244-Pinguiococcus_pyrenoidosus.AAC.3
MQAFSAAHELQVAQAPRLSGGWRGTGVFWPRRWSRSRPAASLSAISSEPREASGATGLTLDVAQVAVVAKVLKHCVDQARLVHLVAARGTTQAQLAAQRPLA